MKKGFRIAITGPESSGKTALAHALAMCFSESQVVNEYAREFLEARLPETDYTKEDLLFIGDQQRLSMQAANSPLVIFDTDYLVLHIWMSEVFGDLHSVFYTWFKTEEFDLVLLCAPDIEWQPDPLRENETDRWRLFELYKSALEKEGKKYVTVKGEGEDRVSPVIALVQELVEKSGAK